MAMQWCPTGYQRHYTRWKKTIHWSSTENFRPLHQMKKQCNDAQQTIKDSTLEEKTIQWRLIDYQKLNTRWTKQSNEDQKTIKDSTPDDKKNDAQQNINDSTSDENCSVLFSISSKIFLFLYTLFSIFHYLNEPSDISIKFSKLC